ncbi:class C beta-lactamase-related serine hydrolase [Hyunsoonleella flava]|uniref:Class C beta-lactamase-related serine hydrolase n=1 Tax=Hyunsoonleella flava TaxID=2527939 RepID=A0A4Q9FK77_9FLAO|nr:serine hydrolase [Hyunsoonleella flava]TBN04855.1 class C beta-lactamase-related serine hydrolase [Hyunsoonleella flava]
MKTKIFLLLLFLSIAFGCSSNDTNGDIQQPDESVYFPPINSDTWETKSIDDLSWNQDALVNLLDFLDEKNTKSFIILHDGKIVLEEYMNGHDASKPWYWASAGKTLTTAISGIAQDEGIIDLNAKVSNYLGEGWTSALLEKENLITCKHLLSMNSGLDDSLGDNVSKENLQYKADAGTRWAYHNVYKKMQDVVALASGSNWNTYFTSKLKNKIGMTGNWIQNSDFNVYWSNTRSMARFGLLIYAKGKWNNSQIVPESFLSEATNTSQDINKSYGYLWWLNGKASYHLPATQLEFNGELIPNAPDDTFAALGKNDQKIYVVPSKKLVIIRMGNKANNDALALSSFDNDLWEKINLLIN